MLGELPVFQSIGASFFDFTKHLVYSLSTFVSAVNVKCSVAYGDACFDLVNSTFHAMTPMADARQVVSALSAEYEACEHSDYVRLRPPTPSLKPLHRLSRPAQRASTVIVNHILGSS